MTNEERINNVLLSTALGDVFPLWGVIESEDGTLRCECPKGKKCLKSGKHPRFHDGKATANSNPRTILTWLEMYPHGNFGVVMGKRAFALDADIRPGEGKNGMVQLSWIEMDAGQEIPHTISVASGRANGSRHFFFDFPKDVALSDLTSSIHGVDLIKNGYCVTPGSRHISGNYYCFEDDCSPVTVVKLPQAPAFLLDVLLLHNAHERPGEAGDAKSDHSTRTKANFFPTNTESTPRTLDSPPEGAIASGRFRPDFLIIRSMMRFDKVAAKLFDGHRKHLKKNGDFDRSVDDFALACRIAFWSAHHWSQYVRLFKASKLYGEKTTSWTSGDYVTETLHRAFLGSKTNWESKPRKSRATGAMKGRKRSSDTQAVVSFCLEQSSASAREVSLALSIPLTKVKVILTRLKNRFYRL